MSERDKQAAIMVMKAAGELRKAAVLDKKRTAELISVADYLESIIHESELGYGDPLFPQPPPGPMLPEEKIKRMINPFKVRLSR